MSAFREAVADVRFVLGSGARSLPVAVALMMLAAFLDLVGVALVAPFLAGTLRIAAPPLPGGFDPSAHVTELGLALVAVFSIKALAAFRVQRRITLISERVRADLMSRLLDAFQRRPYAYHLARNSSDLINMVLWHTASFTGGLLAPALQFAANTFVVLGLATWLAVTSPTAFLLLAVVLTATFVVVAAVLRPKLQAVVAETSRRNAEVIHSVSQALGGWREIRILGRERVFRARLERSANDLAILSARQSGLQLVPRHAIELAIVSFLVALSWIVRNGGSAQALLPLLGTFAAAAMRLLPASTSLLSTWTGMRANRFTARVLADELRVSGPSGAIADVAQPRMKSDPFASLEVDRVTFRYASGAQPALQDASLLIRAGETIGIMGRSGSGKSTLADLVLGLLEPEVGEVRVNGRDIRADIGAWHRRVAYIPQSVYLLDDTLSANIALGVATEEVDTSRLRDAVSQAQLTELVATLPQGIETVVGERGVRLSGGQRQRVAIARALYHDRDFLILDEATSALDTETEKAVVSAINALAGSKTLFVIAHRESTLAGCDRIIRLEAGRIESPLCHRSGAST